MDRPGVAVLSAALVLLVLPLVLGQGECWPGWTWACLTARRAVGWGLAAQSACAATYFAVLFTLALYLQQGLGESAAYSGLALVSWVAAFGLPGPVVGRFPGWVWAPRSPACSAT